MRIDRKKVKPEEKIVWPKKVLSTEPATDNKIKDSRCERQGINEDDWEEFYENAKISQQTQ